MITWATCVHRSATSDILATGIVRSRKILKISKWLPIVSALLCVSSVGPNAHAQDDAFQTGQTARAYNYFQAVYLFDQEGIDLPVLFNLQVSLHPNFVFSAEYLNLAQTDPIQGSDGNDYDVKVEIASSEVGFGFHTASKRWPRIDWLVDVLYSQIKFSGRFVGAVAPGAISSFSISDNSIVTQLGVRGTITPKIEAQAVAVTYYQDGDFGNELLDLTAVYRASDHVDIAIGARNALESPNYNLGLRYNW